MLFNILKIKPIFVIRYQFSMLFDAGLSIVRNRFWVHIQCRFDILKYRAALLQTSRAMREIFLSHRTWQLLILIVPYLFKWPLKIVTIQKYRPSSCINGELKLNLAKNIVNWCETHEYVSSKIYKATVYSCAM